MAGALAFSEMQQETPQACVVDLVPPTGGAITSLANNGDGSLKIQCALAVDPTAPITYEYYLSQTLATLFDPANVIARSPLREFNAYRDANNASITRGATYYAGVRPRDGAGNLNQNTTSLSVIANGLEIASLITEVLKTFIPPGQNIEVAVSQSVIEVEAAQNQEIAIKIEEC